MLFLTLKLLFPTLKLLFVTLKLLFVTLKLSFYYQALKEGREPDLSDYKDFKITCENIGYKMLMNMGWEEGTGLGSKQQGITAPVNK